MAGLFSGAGIKGCAKYAKYATDPPSNEIVVLNTQIKPL